MSKEDAEEPQLSTIAERLLKKTIAVNQVYWENTIQQFSDLASGQTQLSDWQKQGTHLWGEAYNGMVRIGFQYAENLLDFGMDLSNTLFTPPKGDSDAEKTRAAKPPPDPLVVRLTGEPGNQLTSAFALNSKEPFVQKGSFTPGSFYAVNDGKTVSIKLQFEPMEFEIQPEQPLQVVMSIGIPTDIVPGRYHCPVEIKGLGDSRFEILLEVSAKTEKTLKPQQKKPTPRKKQTNSK